MNARMLLASALAPALLFASAARAQSPTAAEIVSACGNATWPPALWTWVARDDPDFPVSCSPPVVVQMTDDDGDGLIGPGDVADVVVVIDAPTGGSRIIVLDGRNGTEVRRFSENVGRRNVAAADVDSDGRMELAALRPAGDGVMLLDDDGTVLWNTVLPPPGVGDDPLGFADFDQDGTPEIFVGGTVLDSTGAIRFRGAAGLGGLMGEQVSHAVDVHPSPGLELLVGRALYAADGTLIWSSPAALDGFTGVGDVDGDGAPEIVTMGVGFVAVVDAGTGGSRGAPFFLPSTRQLSSPTIADFDGDGRQEIFTASQDRGVLLRYGGTGLVQVWETGTRDLSCCAGSSAFDFDGDGRPEILYADERHLMVLDASTGAPLFSTSSGGSTGLEHPIVVDLEGDGTPEIVSMTCGGRVDVIACPCLSRPRRIWNQVAYHATNVEDDGRVPIVEAAPWVGAGWGVQPRGPVEPCAPPVHGGGGCSTCADLYRTITDAAIDVEGVRTSFHAKSDAACRALERHRRNAAANVLGALLAEVSAQDGRHVTPDSAQVIRDCVAAFAQANGLTLRPRRTR